MADTKKQDVAKTEPEQRTVSQRVRDAATLMESPAERARALQVVSKNMQWSGQLTAPEMGAYELIAHQCGVSLTNGTAFVLGGNLYISLQGRLSLAHDSGQFLGFRDDRPMTTEEREAFGWDGSAAAWTCTAGRRRIDVQTRQPVDMYFTDYGRVTKGEKNPVAGLHPLAMAQARARARALKMAFPCGLQSYEEAPPIYAKATNVTNRNQIPGPDLDALRGNVKPSSPAPPQEATGAPSEPPDAPSDQEHAGDLLGDTGQSQTTVYVNTASSVGGNGTTNETATAASLMADKDIKEAAFGGGMNSDDIRELSEAYADHADPKQSIIDEIYRIRAEKGEG